jgi:hypothetical protein
VYGGRWLDPEPRTSKPSSGESSGTFVTCAMLRRVVDRAAQLKLDGSTARR